jgi:type IV secretion system protein TrbF
VRRSRVSPEVIRVNKGATVPAKSAGARAVAAAPLSNPYLEARREWNERYGDYIKQAHHWRTIAIICSATTLVCVLAVGYIGAQNKVVPYVVEVDRLGETTAVARADRPPTVDPRVIKAYLARFAVDWRAVTVDRVAQKIALDRVYSMLPAGSIALRKLNEFFKAHNPFGRAAKESVAVAVTNILPVTDTTWQVEWQETTRDTRGQIGATVRMRASVIVSIMPPTQEQQILINPLGVYLTDLNWSQQL